MSLSGLKDAQTVVRGGARAAAPKIAGVAIHEIGNVLTRSGCLTEIFRADWLGPALAVRQVNWAMMYAGCATDCHCHGWQTDHTDDDCDDFKHACWDDREDSPTKCPTDTIRIG